MRRFLHTIVFVLMSLCTGCAMFVDGDKFAKKYLIAQFSSSYMPGYHGKMNINGYYYIDKRFTSDEVMVFYPDGAYVTCVFNREYEDSIGKAISNFKKVAEVNGHGPVCTGGIYKVQGDTLTVDELRPNFWRINRRVFHIEDESTLIQCMEINIEGNSITEHKKNEVYKFAPARSLYNIYEIFVKENSNLWSDNSERKAFLKDLKNYNNSRDKSNIPFI